MLHVYERNKHYRKPDDKLQNNIAFLSSCVEMTRIQLVFKCGLQRTFYFREDREVLCKTRVSTAVPAKFVVVLNVTQLGR
jgi:hypothetical protein